MLPGAHSEVDVESHQISTTIVGVNRELEKQIRAFIGEDFSINSENLPEKIDQMVDDAKKSLTALGYYEAQVDAEHSTYKNNTVVKLNVRRGKPVRISNIELVITGDAATHKEFQSLIGSLPIKKGQAFNHGDYERTKDLLHSNARNLGYFDAKFDRAQVLITRRSLSAKVYIEFDSGKRHRIKNIQYETTLFDDAFLKRWQPFGENIPYRASHALNLTQNLQNSGYFKFVRVRPQSEVTNGTDIPLVVELEPARENVMSIGLGYATDTDLRIKASWLRPHHNDKGHILKADTSISRLSQEISASYQIPHKRSPATGKYTLNFGILNHRTEDTFSQLRTLNISDQRLTKRDWYRDIFLRWENENTDDGNDRINLLLPGFSFSRTKSSGGIKPGKGTFYSFRALGASTKLLSDINMLRLTAAAKKLKSWKKRHYLITRLDLGILNTQSFSRVPPSHRFFAGGDSSVRGFEYQSISPINNDGEATGGKFLTTASAEYNFYFRDRWAIAGFIDAGRAFIDFDAPYRAGVGAGLRWLSPVGPLRIDLAVGISEEEKPYRLHLAIGPQL